MNIVIIEDEPLAASKLENLIFEQEPNAQIVAILASIEAAVSWFQENPSPHLVFSDIQIADGLSFEIFKRVSVGCPIIFTTAYDQYAIDAFEVNSIDYLLKPISSKKMAASFQKLKNLQLAFQQGNSMQIEALIQAIQKPSVHYKSRFLVKHVQKIKSIKTEDIAYFHAHDGINLLVTKDGNHYAVDYSLDDLSSMLDPEIFFRVNRKYVINIDSVVEIHPYFKGRLKLILSPETEEDVVISTEKTPSFKKWLSN